MVKIEKEVTVAIWKRKLRYEIKSQNRKVMKICFKENPWMFRKLTKCISLRWTELAKFIALLKQL